MRLGNAQVARQCTFESAAHCITVDGGNGHKACIHHRFKGSTEARYEFARGNLVTLKAFQVSACRKEFFTLTGDDSRINILVRVQFRHEFLHRFQRFRRPGVCGRIIDGDDAGVTFDDVLNHVRIVHVGLKAPLP